MRVTVTPGRTVPRQIRAPQSRLFTRRAAATAALGIGLLVPLTLTLASDPVPLPEMPALGAPVAIDDDPSRQFDFWLGEWEVQNKHLRDGAWVDSGKARALIQSVAGGNAVLEQWNGTVGGNPLIGMSLRAYDPALGKWMVYLNWHGGESRGFSEMHGVRRGERMELFPPGDDSQMRYSFSLAREGSCQWDSARSQDGETWRTDWVMQFTRKQPPSPADADTVPIVQQPESTARFPRARELDFLIGSWTGTARSRGGDGAWTETATTARISTMIEGFGLILFLDNDTQQSFAALGFDRQEANWVALRADSGRQGLLRMTGAPETGTVSFTGLANETMVREVWSRTDNGLSYEQSVSDDGGESWEPVRAAVLMPAS